MCLGQERNAMTKSSNLVGIQEVKYKWFKIWKVDLWKTKTDTVEPR